MRLRFDEHSIDSDRRELARAGSLIAVEPQVFDLLLHLIRHRDRVVSKDELIEFVWRGRIVSESTLTSRITAARQAIGDSGAVQSLIRTIHRKGLRFVGTVQEDTAAPAAAPSPEPPVAPLLISSASVWSEKPSIAVLPFNNLSGDPDQEFLADGMVEDIITELSRIRWLFVIARNSTFTYKGQAVDIRRVGSDLGARYVLEGSSRRAGNRVRITAQLIDAVTGAHIWAERYDRALDDVFALQDEITAAIVRQTVPAMTQAEQSRALRKPPESLDAWENYQRGVALLMSGGDQDNALATAFFERAIALDPHFAAAHIMLGQVTMNTASRGRGDFEAGRALAELHARRGIALDPDDSGGHYVVSWTASWAGDLAAMFSHAERAVEAGPSDARAHVAMGRALIFTGQATAAGPFLEKALRLSPRDPSTRLVLLHIALAAFYQDDHPAAIAVLRRCNAAFPAYPHAYLWLAAALGQTEQITEARAALAHLLTTAPAVLAASLVHRLGWATAVDRDRLVSGLRRAGWVGQA